MDSIDLIGIINPPIVRKKKEKYQIICGRKRLLAANDLGLKKVLCKVVPSWIDDLTCLTIAFEENLTARGFNLIEQALVVEKFLHYLSEEEVINNILPKLGYGAAYKNLEFLIKLNFLEEDLKVLIFRESLSSHVAIKLLSFEEKDRKAIVDLFLILKPSVSRQRQILEMLEDLSCREEKSIRELLETSEIQEILTNEKLNSPQKTEKLYNLLRKRLFPRLTEREEAFRKWANKFSEIGIRIFPSQSFEKDSYLLQLEFKDQEDLFKKWQEFGKKLKS